MRPSRLIGRRKKPESGGRNVRNQGGGHRPGARARVWGGMLVGLLLFGGGFLFPISPYPEDPFTARPGVCLVLSGGGARGLAHVGVLKLIDELGVHPACIVGTSAGALVGALYCSGLKAAEIEKLLLTEDFSQTIRDNPERKRLDYDSKRHRMPPALTLEFKKGVISFPEGVLEGQRVLQKLDETFLRLGVTDIRDFDSLPIPFRAVAADVRSGRLVVFKEGRLTTAVRASIAVPLLFTPVHLDDMLLVDGGVLNNVAVDVARELGYRKIVAVNVAKALTPDSKRLDNLFDIMDEAYTLARREKDAELLKMADVVIEPGMEGISVTDFNRVAELLSRGYEAAAPHRKALGRLFAGERPAAVAPPPGVAKYDATVGVVGVSGTRQVSPSRVLHKSDVRPGRKLDPEELGASVENIYAMDQFRRVDYDLSFRQGILSLEYLVEEKARRQLAFTLHFDTDYQFIGLGRFSNRNFLGTPTDFEVQVAAGLVKDYRMILKAPIRFSSHTLNLKVEGYYASQPRELFLNKEPFDRFDERHAGVAAGTTLSLGNSFGFFGNFHLERVDIRSMGAFDERGKNLDAFFRLGAGVDTLDDWSFPRSGFRLEAAVEKHTRLFGRGEDFTKASATADCYFPLGRSLVMNLAGNLMVGEDVPVYQLFYAGGYNQTHWGSTVLPGYRLDELFGQQLWTASLEMRKKLRFATTGIIDASYLFVRGAVAGVRIPDFSGAQVKLKTPIRAFNGVGAGVALSTRIGPVRLFLGFGEDRRVNWTLTIGPEF